MDVAARNYEEQEPRPKLFRQSPAESESPQTLQFTGPEPEPEQEHPAEDGCAESQGLGNDRLTGGSDARNTSARFYDSSEAASAGQGVQSSEDSQLENSNDAHDVSEEEGPATSQRSTPAEEDGSADRASQQAAPWERWREDSEFGARFGKSGGHYAWTDSGASRVHRCGSPPASAAEQVSLSHRADSSFFTSSPFSFPPVWTVAPTDSRRRRSPEEDFAHHARVQTTTDRTIEKDFLHARHQTTERNAEEKSSLSEPCFKASALRDSADAAGDKDSDAGRSDAGAWVPVYGAAGGGVSRALRCRGEGAGAARVETAAEEEEDERQWEDVVQEEEGSGHSVSKAFALPPSTLPRQSLKGEFTFHCERC